MHMGDAAREPIIPKNYKVYNFLYRPRSMKILKRQYRNALIEITKSV